MIRTQIQLPDDSYKTVKMFAKSREIPFAEVIRRAVEEFFARRPGALNTEEWIFPEGRDLGLREDIDWSAVKDDLYLRDPFKSRDEQ